MKPRKNLSAVVRAALPGILALGLVALSMGGCDLSSILPSTGNGNNPPAQTVPPPQPVFTKPVASLTAPAGMPVPITWFATSDSKTVVSQLYYDKDGLKNTGDEVLLTQASKVAKDYSANAFTWDTTGMLLGTYHLLVVASDGVNTPVTVYSNYTVTIVDSTPAITVTEPFTPVSVTPAENVVLKWTQYAPLAPSKVTLYYDDDINRANGYVAKIVTLDEPASSTGDTYVWNVPAIPAGQYYILAELDFGTGTIFSYSPSPVGVSGPAVQLFNPPSAVTWHGGGQLSIRYQVVGAKNGTTITLFYEDGGGTKINLITLPVTSDNPASWTWNSGPLPSGTYKIGGMVNDGINDPATMTAYATGTVTDTGPTFQITAPAGAITVHAGDVVPVTFSYQMNGGTATVKFYLDNDTDSTNGYSGGLIPGGTVSNLQPTATTGSINLTMPVVPVGTYYIAGVFDNGTTQIVDYVGGGAGTGIAVIGPQLILTQPTLNGNILPGTPLTISWSNMVPDGTTNPASPKVWMFYTTNKADSTTYQDIIAKAANANPNTINGGSLSQSWTIPGTLTGGPWYIGAIVTDEDGNATPATWAPCALTMITRDFFSRDLGLVEADALGRTFQGFSPNGQLGKVMTQVPWKRVADPKDPGGNLRRQPGIKMNGDAYDDFVLTAPTGDSYYLQRGGSGESYLVLSDPKLLFVPPVVGPFAPIVMSAAGTTVLPGAIFTGPASTSTTSGISSVALSRATAQDGRPALLFGVPYVNKIYQEEQDYDPWDNLEYQMEGLFNTQASPVHFYTNYLDTYRQPTLANETNADGAYSNPPNIPALSGWNTITGGMLVAVSGANPPVMATTAANVSNVVIPLDNVGQISRDPHPNVVPPTLNGNGNGVRFYCPWMFNTAGVPKFGPFPATAISGGDNGDDESRFGESVVEADLDGTGNPVWIVTQPRNHTSGAVDAGWLHVIWTASSNLWTTPLSSLTWKSTWNAYATTVTNTAAGQTVAGPVLMPLPPGVTDTTNAVRTWSWPYAFATGSGRVDLQLFIDQAVTPATYSWSKIAPPDSRNRWFAWPVVSDFVHGDTTDAPAGKLSGLSNVGDFNGDGREDITAGTPGAAPGAKANAGCVYLIFGRGAFADSSLNNVGNGSLAGIKIVGENAGDMVGSSQASAGDFNGDGLSDWIIGVPGYNGGRGLVAIIYGSTTIQGQFKVSDIGTAKLPGVVLTGEAAGSGAGTCVAGVGDVDGDGFDDVVIIAPQMDWTFSGGTTRTQGGIAYLIYGGPSFTGTLGLDQVGKGSLPGMIYVGPHKNEALTTAAPAGDVDADGYADFLIGDPNYNVIDPLGNTLLAKVGQVYLIRGGPRLTP